MTLHVEPITGLWFVVNAGALILTLVALGSAIRDRRYAVVDESPSHEAREVIASGNVRREALRILQLLLLLSLVIPAVLSQRSVVLTPPIIALILVPIVLFTSTVYDARDRRRLARMLVDLVRIEQSQYAQESSLQENIALTKEVGDKADAAYHEANTVNEKIVQVHEEIKGLTKLVAGKEDKP